jgi:hypothetical protein
MIEHSKNNKSDETININLEIAQAYIDESPIKIDNIPIKLNNNSSTLLNNLLDTLVSRGHCNLTNTVISYYDYDLNSYVYCGIYPFKNKITIPIDKTNLKIVNK